MNVGGPVNVSRGPWGQVVFVAAVGLTGIVAATIAPRLTEEAIVVVVDFCLDIHTVRSNLLE